MEIKGRVVHPPSIVVNTTREIHPAEKYVAVDENGFLQASPETSGFDVAEGVFKVASYVWDTTALQWVRSTGSGGSGGTVTTATKTKLYDQASSTVLYAGEADPGSATSSAVWRIKRLTFSAAGDVTAVQYALIGASICIWDNRASLSYS